MHTNKSPIERACEAVGSQAEMARILGVTPAMVNQLTKGHRPIPIEHCYAIETATGGVVTRRELRPDDWQKIWPDLMHLAPTHGDTTKPEPDDALSDAAQPVLIVSGDRRHESHLPDPDLERRESAAAELQAKEAGEAGKRK